ncbi:MAG TPA: M48 family metalloprotease [Candidatus Sulfotelmatobacter sp.]|nr:M48 family metalloprotease [Candidatus Sulfotelmatobacter sp.]
MLQILGQAAVAAGLLGRRASAFTVTDEAADVKMGREADAQILKEVGYYDGPEIQNYVNQIGQRVVAAGDMRFSFQFKVVNQTYVNAMALPGGFVYVTRGMLATLNDEAQLACVLGHEATHVNSRHGAKLLTKALGAQLATLVGIGAAAAVGRGSGAVAAATISGHVTNYMLLGYGREYEQEADEVGQRHAHRAGYDPRRMVEFLRLLRRKERLTGQPLYHGLEASHPDTPIRIAKAETMAELLVSEGGSALLVKPDEYKAQLDGLAYGNMAERRVITIYTAQPGDTLATVARSKLGADGSPYELASLNGLPDDAVLAPGTRLKLIVPRDDVNKTQELRLQKE